MHLQQLVLNGAPTSWRVRSCDTFLARARGLLGATERERCLVWRLRPCRAVHTWFLAGSIDVAFCDRAGGVLRIIAPMRTRQWAWQAGADAVWEFPAGLAVRLALRRGDQLSLCG